MPPCPGALKDITSSTESILRVQKCRSGRSTGEDWGAAIAYAVAAFHRPRVQQLVFQETLLPGVPAAPGLPGGGPDPSLAPDDMRTGWHRAIFVSLA